MCCVGAGSSAQLLYIILERRFEDVKIFVKRFLASALDNVKVYVKEIVITFLEHESICQGGIDKDLI